jgi:hypothetical protein
VFAKYDGNTQTGCHLGLINKYKNKNIEIFEAYDNEKEFFIVNNKKCYGYKEEKYFINREVNDLSIEDKVKYINKTFRINYVAIINICKFTLEELDPVIATLTQCSIPPKKIILVRYQINKDIYAFDNLKQIIDKHNPKEWRVQTILENDEEYLNILHNATNINRNNFILSIDGDPDNICEIIEYAQNQIYNEFENFIVLSNKSKQSIFFNRAVYRASFANGKDILNEYNEYKII